MRTMEMRLDDIVVNKETEYNDPMENKVKENNGSTTPSMGNGEHS